MILLLLVFDLLRCANADTFSLVVPDGFISGQLGSSVVLPCTVSPALDCKSYEVSWYGPKDKDNLILVYKELQVQENTGDPLYRNRVSLIGDLEKGDLSLKLENFTLADRGEYVCYVKSSKWHKEASVFLSLPVVGSSPLLSLAEAGEQVNVTCASGGWAPNTTLTWRDKEGRELTNSVAHYRTEWISCSLGLSDQEMKEGRVLPLKPATVPGCRVVIILFVIGLLMLVLVTVVIFRIRGCIFPKRSQKDSPLTGPLEEEGVNLVVAITPQSSDSNLTLDCWFRERIHTGQYYWEVTGLTDVSHNTEIFKNHICPTFWYVGVTNQSAENRRPFPVTPQNGFWVLQYDKDKGYYVNDPSLTPVLSYTAYYPTYGDNPDHLSWFLLPTYTPSHQRVRPTTMGTLSRHGGKRLTDSSLQPSDSRHTDRKRQIAAQATTDLTHKH
ncbi:hypothetical protein NFI96_022329 [Prochilodus magdalenae]|nr:hypothetical protein NFI96_022329 [Prochilodus magdalenae]